MAGHGALWPKDGEKAKHAEAGILTRQQANKIAYESHNLQVQPIHAVAKLLIFRYLVPCTCSLKLLIKDRELGRRCTYTGKEGKEFRNEIEQ